jgi:hypothetical protein
MTLPPRVIPGLEAGIGSRAAGVQKIVSDTANSFYVMATNTRGTAFAHHFIRNVGGSGTSDVGTPWQPWRISGTAEFPSVSSNPVSDTPIYTYNNDTGAQNYAVTLPSGKFGGSYHGGETVNAMTVAINGLAVDPTTGPYTGSRVTLAYTSTVTDGSSTYTMDFALAVNSDGSVSQTINSISSTASFGRWFTGMAIGQGTYDEAWVNLYGTTLAGTQYKVPISVGTTTYGRTYLLLSDQIVMRKSADGRRVRIASNAPAQAAYRRTSIVMEPSLTRTKLYYEMNTGVPGTIRGISWTMYFDVGAAGTTTFNSNIVTNGTFATDISGWTSTHNPSGVSWNAGALRQVRGGAGVDTRTIQGEVVVTTAPFMVSGEMTYTPIVAGTFVNPGSLGVTNSSNGSLTSADLTPIAFDQNGYEAALVIPSSTTRYVMMLLTAQGATNTSSGDIADWDNLSMIQIGT